MYLIYLNIKVSLYNGTVFTICGLLQTDINIVISNDVFIHISYITIITCGSKGRWRSKTEDDEFELKRLSYKQG